MKNIPILAMGLTSLLMQIIALRKILSVFSGNELVIGIILAVWLASVGTGSFIARAWTSRSFALTFAASGLLIHPAIFLIDRIPRLFSVLPGETVSLGAVLLASFLCLFPLGAAFGTQFPVSAAFLEGKASKAYGLEAAGAFTGALLFTLIASGRIGSFTVASLLSAINILIAVMVSRTKLLSLLLAFPLVLYFGSHGIFRFSHQDMRLVQTIESRYGEIAVFKDRDQMNVFASGAFQYSYPDLQTEEMKAHVALSLDAAPSDVLVIGGSFGALRELLKYSVSSVDFVEIDPRMIDVSLGLLTDEDRKLTKDPRIRIRADDARKFIRSVPNSRYDLVLLNLPEPSTAALNRFYTIEFFSEVKAAMKQRGILCLGLPASQGYIGRNMQFANGSVYASLKTVFPNVAVSSEEYGGLFASSDPIETRPDRLAERFSSRRIRTSSFYPLVFRDMFDPLKTGQVKGRLEKAFNVNSDRLPVAYLYNLILWSEIQGGGILKLILGTSRSLIAMILAAVVLTALALWWRKRGAVPYAVFTGGYSSMSLSIVILLAFQARYGYVYESIGLIMAMFMAGAAAGTLWKTGVEKDLVLLRLIDIVTMLLLAASPWFLAHEPLYYLLALLAGIIGGTQFSASVRFGSGHGISAGALYAIDLAGSIAGALLTAVLLVPLFGLGNSVFLLIALKASSLILLFGLPSEPHPHPALPLKGRVNYFSLFKGETKEGDG